MANILYHVDAWAGRTYNAGSESMNNTMAKYLASKGHSVHVLTNPTMAFDGEVRDGLLFFTKILDQNTIDEQYAWADFVVTSIAFTPRVVKLCREKNKRLIYIIHNNHSVPFWEVKPSDCWLAVYNADWIKEYHNKKFEWKPEREMTMYPPVLFDEYSFEDNSQKEYITLVNLNENKGVLTLIMAAKMLPQYKFLGVKGSYGDQIVQLPPNVTVINNTHDMVNDVYKKSKIVMMPSKKETWGMVAIEAMCSGIPVLAHPTDGLVEACGDAGIFLLREKALLWDAMLKRLMEDQEYYDLCSNKCIERSRELSEISTHQLEEWERIIRENAPSESLENNGGQQLERLRESNGEHNSGNANRKGKGINQGWTIRGGKNV